MFSSLMSDGRYHHVHDEHSIGELDAIVSRLDGFSVSVPNDVNGESGLSQSENTAL